ncbi:MAG: hypothetical protein ABJA80_08170 [bacterium]
MTTGRLLRGALGTLCYLAGSVSIAAAQDSSFAAMQKRGGMAMGVDQYTSVHRFDDLANGGRIRLERDRDDTAGAHAIQAHLRGIAKAFATGDFSTPAFVHMRAVPGTKDMADRRRVIRYAFTALPRGGELRITTSDTTARRAVHEFLAFQRGEHHAAGQDMHDMHGMHDMSRPHTGP